MKTIVYEKYGLSDVLQIGYVSNPVPGDNHVLIKSTCGDGNGPRL